MKRASGISIVMVLPAPVTFTPGKMDAVLWPTATGATRASSSLALTGPACVQTRRMASPGVLLRGRSR